MAVPIKIVPPSKKKSYEPDISNEEMQALEDNSFSERKRLVDELRRTSINEEVPIDVSGTLKTPTQTTEEQPSLPVKEDETFKLPKLDPEQATQLNDKSNLRALLVGATPLLAGFLGGNMGDAYDIAGKGLIQEDLRRQKQDASLLALLKKKSGNGTGSEVTTTVFDPKTGKWHVIPRSLAVRGNVTSEEMARYPEAPKWESASSVGEKAAARAKGTIGVRKAEGLEDFTVQGAEGQPMRVTKGTLEAKPIDTGAGAIKSQSHMGKVESSVKQFQSDTKAIRDAIDAGSKIKDIAQMKLPEADAYLTFLLPKMAGSGQLSDEERKAFTGGGSISDWVKMWSSRKSKGVFPEHIRNRMIELASLLNKRALDRYSRLRNQHINTQSKILNIPRDEFAKYMPDEAFVPKQKESGLSPEQRQQRILQLKKELGHK